MAWSGMLLVNLTFLDYEYLAALFTIHKVVIAMNLRICIHITSKEEFQVEYFPPEFDCGIFWKIFNLSPFSQNLSNLI